MEKFKYRTGYSVKGVSASTAAKELERIRKKNGGSIKNGDVVKESKAKKAPLHPAFEWRNDVAANQYRLVQERRLVRSVVVVSDELEQTPVYVNVKELGSGSRAQGEYKRLEDVAQDELELESVLNDLQAQLRGLEKAIRDVEVAAEAAGNLDSVAIDLAHLANHVKGAMSVSKDLAARAR